MSLPVVRDQVQDIFHFFEMLLNTVCGRQFELFRKLNNLSIRLSPVISLCICIPVKGTVKRLKGVKSTRKQVRIVVKSVVHSL